MNTRWTAIAVLLLVPLASCSRSAASGPATSAAPTPTPPTSSGKVTTTTTPKGTMMHWHADAVPGVPEQKCNATRQCVLLGTETGTLEGDLQGTTFVGTSGAFAKSGQFVVGRTDIFRGTVKGCGTGTLVFLGTEIADTHRGSGEWQIPRGFGTGELAHVTGHGTGRGTVDAKGFRSEWEGVIDCSN